MDRGDACLVRQVSGDVIVSKAVWDEVNEECNATPRGSAGFRALTNMEKTVRKRSVNRPTASVHLSTQALRGYVPPLLLSAYTLEATIGQSLRAWTVSVVQASVLFINLGIGGLMNDEALDCKQIHVAVLTVQRIVSTLQGCIHRFTVDDKGYVMKVVFGAHLPHEDQPYRALLAALQLRQALSIQGIQPAVGVASGLSLIGPVGSAARQEFTVHGDRIILAARLMQLAAKYGGMVLCDEQTYACTRDDVRFVQLQPVELKGKSVLVRPYRPVASSELLQKPTLSVKTDAEYCTSLDAIKGTLDQCSAWLAEDDPSFRSVVVTGSHGMGKTQLLMQARAKCEPSSRVLHVRCRAHEAGQRGALLRRLFAQLCGHDVWPSLQHITPMVTPSSANAEEALVEYELKLLHSHAAAGSQSVSSSPNGLCDALFSPPLPSAQARTEGSPAARDHSEGSLSGSVHSSTVNDSFKTQKDDCGESFKSFVEDDEFLGVSPATESASGRLTLIIDDIQHADAHSSEVLTRLAKSAPSKVLMLLACREPRVSLGKQAKTLDDAQQFSPGHRLAHNVIAMKDAASALYLRPVGAGVCQQLACAELGVPDIPQDAGATIYRRSGGCPQLCQSIARNLVSRGALTIDQDEPRRASLPTPCPERLLNAAATEALVESCHAFLCVKLAELSILQQLVLKTMSLLRARITRHLLPRIR